MGVTRGLLTGFTLAGIVTFAYEQNLYTSSAYLRNALVSLSKDLDSLRIQSRVDEVPKEPVSLEKLRLGDQMKMQWNDQLLRGVNGLYTTNWPQAAANAYYITKAETKALVDRFSS